MPNGTQVLDPEQEDPLVALFRESQESRDAPAPGTAAGTEEVDLIEQFRISETDRISPVPPPPVIEPTEDPSLLERGAALVKRGRDLLFPQDPGRRGLPTGRPPVSVQPPEQVRPLFGEPVEGRGVPVDINQPNLPRMDTAPVELIRDPFSGRMVERPSAPPGDVVAEANRLTEELGVQQIRVPRLARQRSIFDAITEPFRQRREDQVSLGAAPDAVRQPELHQSGRARPFGAAPPIMRAATRMDRILTEITKAGEGQQAAFEAIPLPVRMTISAARGQLDAITAGRFDSTVSGWIDQATTLVRAQFGLEPTELTVEQLFTALDRSLPEKFAGGAAFLATAGAGIRMSNQVISGLAPLAAQGTRMQRILTSFDPLKPALLSTRAIQGALEGIPYDLAFEADNPGEMATNLVIGLVGGALLGGVVGGKLKRSGDGSLLGATGVAGEFLAGGPRPTTARQAVSEIRPISRDRIQPKGRQTAREAIRATSDTEGLPGISERVETDPVPQSTRQRRSQSRGDEPGRRASDLEAQPVEITAGERIRGTLDPARDIDPELGVQSKPTWIRARPRFEANPDVEIIFFDVRQLKPVNDYISFRAGTAELNRIAQLILKEAEGLGISPRQVFRAGGDEFAIPVPVGEGERVARQIADAVGTKRVGDTEFETSLRWGVGQTQDLADAAQASAKARETQVRHRGAGGAKRAADVAGADTPRADVTETSRASDRFNPDVETRVAPQPDGPAAPPKIRPRDVSDPPPGATPLGVQANGRGGFFDLDTLTRVGKAAKAFVRRRFTSAGDLPKAIYELKIKASSWVSAQMSDIRFTLRRYDRALELSYGTRTPDAEDVFNLNQALSGKADLDQIPAPMRPVIRSMREQVDALSSQFIANGIAKGKMVATIADNMGTYLTRSYRVFEDTNWQLQNIPPDIVNAAKAFLRAERPDLDADQIQGLIKKILDTQDTSPLSFLTGTLGSKDLSMLIKRKDIHPAIRALMGEFKDARLNYARSVTKMSNTMANHEFLTEVARRFTGTPGREGGFFFRDAVTRGDQDFTELIAAKGSEVMAPLNGLHTTPEIALAFEEAFSHRSFDGLLGVYMKANGLVKFDKTVLSLMTHNRNLIGNFGFAVANGHWRMQHAGRAIQAINASVGITAGGRRAARAAGLDVLDPRLTSTQTLGLERKLRLTDQPGLFTPWERYYKKLQTLGVVDQSAHAGELQDALLDATKGGLENISPDAGLLERGIRGGVEIATSFYRAEDDLWKVIAFENEFARYRKALGADVSDVEVEETAAWIVRNTYPTYSMVPSGVKFFRLVPVIGPFTSFPAEVYRTLYHTITIGLKEIRSPNAGIRKIGAERLTGLAVAGLGLPAAAMASRFMNGITADDDRDIRPFLAPWSRNSSLIYTDKGEDGTFGFIDMSYTDPYSYVRDPMRALFLGEDWQESLKESVLQAMSPFFSEEILAGKIYDVARNTKKSGGQVWNPEAHPIDQFQAITAHFWDALEPGTISSARRIAKGISGKTTVFGQAYDARLEAMAVLTGHRLSKVDVKQSLSFRTGEMSGRIRDANRILTRTGTRRGTLSQEDLIQAYEESEASRARVFNDAHNIAQAAIRLGLTSREVEVAFRDGGMSRANARAVINGDPPPQRQLNSEFRERNALIRTLNQARR